MAESGTIQPAGAYFNGVQPGGLLPVNYYKPPPGYNPAPAQAMPVTAGTINAWRPIARWIIPRTGYGSA